jgi:DNA polymerase
VTALRRAAASCEGCELHADATQTVFGAGRATARLLLVGEQPGDVEDVEGVPFVGPAGRVLDRARAAAGLADVPTYVTNAVKHFHFRRDGKRRLHESPKAGHITACRPWLRAEVAAVRPDLIVCLGAVAAKAVLDNEVRVLRDRGAVLDRDGAVGPGRFVVTVHPSSVLRTPAPDRAAAFAGLVADLEVAAAFLR